MRPFKNVQSASNLVEDTATAFVPNCFLIALLRLMATALGLDEYATASFLY